VNKRISTLSLFVVGTLLLGLMGAIAALAAPSGADATGSVALDKAWYTTGVIGSGSVVTVTVTDADKNTEIATSTTFTNDFSIGESHFVAFTVATGAEIKAGSVKVMASGQTCPSGTASTNLAGSVFISGASATTGTMEITAAAAENVSSAQSLCFTLSSIQTIPSADLKIWSTQTGETGAIALAATETGSDTGVFTATIILIDTATDTAGYLHALNLNTLSAKYTDTTPSTGTSVAVTSNATVETAVPTVSNLTPVNKFATQNADPTFTGTISDSGAGLDVSTIVVGIDVDDTGVIDADEKFVPTVTGVDGDLQVTFTISSGVFGSLPETAATGAGIDWQIEATDLAGNVGLSDSDPDVTGSQTSLIRIDKSPPVISSAETGNFWDLTLVTPAVGANKKTTIEVKFDEDLDATTVTAADFTVDSGSGALSPISADVYSGAPKSVFLTLAADLAADNKPTVAIAVGGAVSDAAGNAINVGTATATDNIAPTFTVTLDATLTKNEVVVSISSDEKISGVPVVKIWRHNLTAPISGAGIDAVDVDEKTLIVLVKSLTTWEATFAKITGSDGTKSVVVTGSDLSVNAGTAGKTDPATSGSITFIQDTSAPTVAFEPDGTANVTTAAPFVKANYTDASTVKVTAAVFGLKGETGTDVVGTVFTSDDKQHIYAAKALVVGSSYTFKVTAEDAAGNALKDQSVTFKVAARPEVSLALVPGNNLVSLPGAPANADINSVGLPAGVTSVITYDPTAAGIAAGGPWLVATRDTSGNLVGTLTTVDATHAYWVETTSSAAFKVDIPAQVFQAVPPAIQVVNGWNMVPVVSVAGNAPGTVVSADVYFGSTSWVTAYWFNTAGNAWVKVLPNQIPAHTVTVGNGYWLYAGAAGVLVP